MANPTTGLTFLRLIDEHEGEWGWYQFERAFPPGWFADEPPDTRAMDVLKTLERDGLIAAAPDDPMRKYRLTDRGKDALRRAVVESL